MQVFSSRCQIIFSLATPPAINTVGRLKCWWPPPRELLVSLWNVGTSTRCATHFKCPYWNVCDLKNTLWSNKFHHTPIFLLPCSNSKLDHPHFRILWLSKTNSESSLVKLQLLLSLKSCRWLLLLFLILSLHATPFHLLFLNVLLTVWLCYVMLCPTYELHSQGYEQLHCYQ